MKSLALVQLFCSLAATHLAFAGSSWRSVSNKNAPEARKQHSLIWTGKKAVVWGGSNMKFSPDFWPVVLNTGGMYDPSTDAWTPTSLENAPDARAQHSAIWTGKEMIIWGGYDDQGEEMSSGARFNPETNEWKKINPVGAPRARSEALMVWTGKKVAVWGGSRMGTTPKKLSGSLYDPEIDEWEKIADGGPDSDWDAKELEMFWTGKELLVVAGKGRGAFYNIEQKKWRSIRSDGAPMPFAQNEIALAWTGTNAIAFGFANEHGSACCLITGTSYVPEKDTWIALETSGAPKPRKWFTSAWTGKAFAVWGGAEMNQDYQPGSMLNDGAIYDPATNKWSLIPQDGAPSPRIDPAMVSIGDELFIWGGDKLKEYFPLGDGGIYRP